MTGTAASRARGGPMPSASTFAVTGTTPGAARVAAAAARPSVSSHLRRAQLGLLRKAVRRIIPH